MATGRATNSRRGRRSSPAPSVVYAAMSSFTLRLIARTACRPGEPGRCRRPWTATGSRADEAHQQPWGQIGCEPLELGLDGGPDQRLPVILACHAGREPAAALELDERDRERQHIGETRDRVVVQHDVAVHHADAARRLHLRYRAALCTVLLRRVLPAAARGAAREFQDAAPCSAPELAAVRVDHRAGTLSRATRPLLCARAHR